MAHLMKKLLGSLVALVLVGAVVATTALTDARWSQNDDRNLGEISLMAGSVDFDLAVTMLGNRTVVPSAAAPVEYTVRVHNHGPDDTRNMTVTFQVPLVDGLDLVSVTPQGSDAVCDLSEAATAQPTTPGHGLIVCTVAGPLQAGSTYEVLVEMYAQKALLVSSITATATVSAPRESPKLLGNNTASWLMAYPDPLVDLSILKTGPATVEAGRKAFYTLVVTNTPVLEMVTALPPTVVDTLPAGVTLLPSVVAGSLTPSWCVAAGQVVTCTLPASIPAGSSTTIELSVQFDASLAGTTVTNTATVFNDPTQPDPSLANNTWTATTVVTEGSGNEDICWGTWVGGVCVPDGPVTVATARST
ncbi:MAG: DUF11 domain-containing protein [Micrococcales bacterium]|nr:DUF11 domain-containing protein [Micrococcales bacterium]